MNRVVWATGLAVCSASAMVIATPSLGAPARDDAQAFGMRQSILSVSLSPSGNKLAFITPANASGEKLDIVNLTHASDIKTILTNSDVKADLDRCEWVTDERLVCRLNVVDDATGILIGFSRMFSVDDNGKNMVTLSPHDNSQALGFRQNGGSVIALEVPGEAGKILQSREYVAEWSTGTRISDTSHGLGVDEVDASTGRRTPLEKADPDAAGYIADDKGRVRIKMRLSKNAAGNIGEKIFYFYRDDNGGHWQRLSVVENSSYTGFKPVAVDAAQNLAYGFDTKNGFKALMAVPLDGSGVERTILARDGVDVDDIIQIGRQRRIVGASYATDKREADYFDPELKALVRQLHEALPGRPIVDIAGASADESKLLIVASSDVDPGMLYLYNKATRELNELLPLRAPLQGRTMGRMRPITYKAADGTVVPGYLTLPPGSSGKNLPAVVLPHGGPGARDEWGFDWLTQFFAVRGYAVLQPNYRGSSGYGSDWFGKNGFQAWRTAIGDVNDAGRWLVSQGIADPSKLAIVGWSYGGYAALQSQVLDPSLFKAVVAIAPVTDLDRLRDESRPYTNFSVVDHFIGNGPYVAAGSPARHADRFLAPVSLFHGTLDQNVGFDQSRLMEKRLKDAGKSVSYTEFPDLDHSLSDSKARIEMLTKIDTFLSKTLGTPE